MLSETCKEYKEYQILNHTIVANDCDFANDSIKYLLLKIIKSATPLCTDFKCEEIHRFLGICSQLTKKSLTESKMEIDALKQVVL